jgi:hypothetical protein
MLCSLFVDVLIYSMHAADPGSLTRQALLVLFVPGLAHVQVVLAHVRASRSEEAAALRLIQSWSRLKRWATRNGIRRGR